MVLEVNIEKSGHIPSKAERPLLLYGRIVSKRRVRDSEWLLEKTLQIT